MISLFTRFWDLTRFPPSLFSDEVDIGYQAMVFNRYQTDYFGNKFPIHFHSFSDWQPALGIYASSLVQLIFPNPEISVRLPSAIFGILSIFVLYLITKSLVPSFILAISPWAIHYSRTGFAVSGMIFVILLGIYFWQKFIHSKQTRYVYLSIFFFCLSPYLYSTAKLFLIFIPFLLVFIWRKDLNSLFSKNIVLPILFGLLMLSPMAYDTFRGRSGFRFSYVSIFTLPHREQVTDLLRYQDILLDHPNQVGIPTPPLSFILHNKYQLVAQRFIDNYLASFSTNFLFISGDGNIRHGFGGHGLLYFVDFILIFIGLIAFFNKPDKLGTLFLLMLILGPIPFALTRDSLSAHATRLIIILPSIVYFISRGVGKKYYLLPLYFLFLLNFWHYYTTHYPQDSAPAWHSGIRETVQNIKNYPNNQIYFSNRLESFLPFFFFYHPYLPDTLSLSQNLITTEKDYFNGQVLDNQYFFGQINWSTVPINDPKNIYVVYQNELKDIPAKYTYDIVKKIDKTYLSAQEFYIIKF